MSISKDAVPRASLSDMVYQRLRAEIMEGDLGEGVQLSQVHLAQRFGVSRIPIREALRRLQAESLVVSTPYHPFVVHRVSPEQVIELIDIRAALEDLALSKRQVFSAEEIAEMRRLNEAMAGGVEPPEFLALDRRLHQLLVGPGTMAVSMIGDVRDKVHKYVSEMVGGRPGRLTATSEHARVIDALERGDLDAARAHLHEHIMASRSFIVTRLDAEGA